MRPIHLDIHVDDESVSWRVYATRPAQLVRSGWILWERHGETILAPEEEVDSRSALRAALRSVLALLGDG